MSAPSSAWMAVSRLESVAALPDDDDIKRGAKVLAAARALGNVTSELVADHVRTLLDSGCWRHYQLPTGEVFEWREAEFDYFLTAASIDVGLVEQSVRSTGDRELMLRLARASDHTDPGRRSVTEILALHPALSQRLAPVRLGGPALHRVLGAPEAQAAWLAGRGADAAAHARSSWRVRWAGPADVDSMARAIADRLTQQPTLARAVADLLNAAPTDHPRVSDAG